MLNGPQRLGRASRGRHQQEVSGKKYDKVVAEAIFTTLEATGDDSGWARDNSYAIPLEAAKRVAQRAKLEEPVERLHEAAFVDRHGELHLPLSAAAKLAQAFAAAEPEAVLHVDSIDEQWTAEGYQPGQRYIHGLLREHQPQFALCRQWAGFANDIAVLRREIERLYGVVQDAIWALKTAGAEAEAWRIERALAAR